MKQVLGLLAALMATQAVFAAEGKTSDVTFSSEFRFRDIWSQNAMAQSQVGSPYNTTKSRIKFDSNWRASEHFTGHLGLLHSAAWGSKDLYINNPGYGSGDTSQGLRNGVTSSDNTVLVNEAYGSWMVTDSFMLKFGRGSLSLGDGSVISTNDYQDFPYSFDGVLGNYEWDFMRLSAWVVKFVQYSSATTTANTGLAAASGATGADPQALAYGLALTVKTVPSWLKLAQAHVIRNQKDMSTGTSATPGAVGYLSNPTAAMGQDSYRYGVTVSGDASNIDYRVDFNGVTGNYRGQPGMLMCKQDKCSAASWMIHGVVGYSMPKLANSHIFAMYHQDSGGDNDGTAFKTYDSYFYNIHDMYNGGLMDVVKWGNLTTWAVGWTVTPLDRFDISLLYYNYKRTNGSTTPFSSIAGPYGAGLIDVTNGLGTATHSSSTTLGQEIDLAANKKYDGGFEVEARAGMFIPGDYVKDLKGGATYTQVFVQGKMAF